jgi:restriction endonuclease S subunit
MKGSAGQQRIPIEFVAKYGIPLPPISHQKEIVTDFDRCQKIIDGARQVIENWKPKIDVDPDWDKLSLGEICEFKRGPFGGSLKKEIFKKEGYLIYEQYHAINNDFSFGRYFIDEKKFEEMRGFEVKGGDLLISCSGTMGKIAIVPEDHKKGIINQALLKLTPNKNIDKFFLKLILETDLIQSKFFENQAGSGIQNVASVKVLKQIPVPVPSLKLQREIVNKIKSEQELSESNKKIIEMMQDQMAKTLDRLWS